MMMDGLSVRESQRIEMQLAAMFGNMGHVYFTYFCDN